MKTLSLQRAAMGAHVRAARRMKVVVRSQSREAQLQELQSLQSGLRKQLEQSAAKPSTGSSSTAATTASAAATEPAAADGLPRKELQHVNKANFHEVLAAAGSRLVVVDCYTEWCGPCKMILPTLEQWCAELEGEVDFVKFNCNKENKELGISLQIKVAPTFILFQNSKEVARMTGAKADKVRELIEQHR